MAISAENRVPIPHNSSSHKPLKGSERRQRHIAEPGGQRVEGRLRLTTSFYEVYSHFHSHFLFAHKNNYNKAETGYEVAFCPRRTLFYLLVIWIFT